MPSAPGPASAASASSAVKTSGVSSRRSCAAARERRGHHCQRHQRRGCDAERHSCLPAGDAQGDGQREAQARDRLHQHEAAVQREVLVAREPPACEVAGGVGQRAHDEHVVERGIVLEDVVDQHFVEGQREQQEREREAQLDHDRDAHRMPRVPPCRAVGDRAREQLFGGAVDHRDDHEHHRPQQIDLLGLRFPEDVAGDREVGERQQARGGDADREDARAAAVGAGRVCARCACLQSRTSSIVHGKGERTSVTLPWRVSSATKLRREKWLRCPGVLPRAGQ